MAWRKLIDTDISLFGPGLLIRFQAEDTLNIKTTAIAVSIPCTGALSFFEIDGNNKSGWPMGYGQPTLPKSSTYNADPTSVQRKWLLENFDHICLGVDPKEIEYLEHYSITPNR